MIIVAAVLAVIWTLSHRSTPHLAAETPYVMSGPQTVLADLPRKSAGGEDHFSCDGRVYCSQMTSCAEAKYFLAHCPGTKMDGDGDGIPCERQFCGNH